MSTHQRQLDDSLNPSDTTNVTPYKNTKNRQNHQKAHAGAASPDIKSQIIAAFSQPPNLARTLMGVRRIKHGCRGRRTSLFASRKNNGSISLESRLELAYAIQLERSSNVRQYRTQAIKIFLPGGQFAVPDFILETNTLQYEVHEIKPAIQHLSANELNRFQLIAKLLEPLCIRFRLIDELDLPSRAELQHLQHLYVRGHALPFTAMQIQLARALFATLPRVCLAEATRILVSHQLPATLADYLFFHSFFELSDSEVRG